VVTNLDFLQALLSHPDFANGIVTTRWVETNLGSGSLLPQIETQPSESHLISAALADLTIVNRQSSIIDQNDPDPYSPWKLASGFRN
jgi:pyruvate carboxylase